MKIETAKTAKFYKAIIDAFATDKDDARKGLSADVRRWSEEVLSESMESALKCKRFFNGEIAVKVSVTIGNADELYDEEEEEQ